MSSGCTRRTVALAAAFAAPALLSAGGQSSPVQQLDRERLEILAWQIALEAAGYSPGLLDGVPGSKTEVALRAFQHAAGLVSTGERDAASRALLEVTPELALESYRVSPADEAQVNYCPPDWMERSRRDRLLYPSLSNLLAERFHTSERFLAWLNPTADLGRARRGDDITVPRLRDRTRPPDLDRLEIDLERKLILLVDAAGTARGLLHCSVARDLDGVVRGETTIKNIVVDPDYTFDPRKWPEVKGIDRKLTIPPGPRSPVGVRWIGLDRPGVGVHGAPEPENIGKTGSHGCFRLTNWDAVHLAACIRLGLPVRVADRSGVLARPGLRRELASDPTSPEVEHVLPPGIRPRP